MFHYNINRLRQLFFGVSLLFVGAYVLLSVLTSQRLFIILPAYQQNKAISPTYDDDFGERGSCIIPAFDPDPSWIPSSFQSLSCVDQAPSPVFIANGSVIVNLDEADVKDGTHCQYAPVIRDGDFAVTFTDDYKELPRGRSPCKTDVFFVTCNTANGTETFSSLMRCVYRKEAVVERAKTLRAPIYANKIFDERLNIVIFGLDSVSRLAWLEQMTKLTEFATNTLGGIIFEGYNIIGDGTTAAILGVLSGYMEEELQESRRGFAKAATVDEYPFLWKQLMQDAGYATLWDEDGANIGTFHYRLKGFDNPPVDHYGRIFQLAFEHKRLSHGSCFGTKSGFDEMIGLFRQLFIAYPEQWIRKFGLVFSSSFTHTAASSGRQSAYTVDQPAVDELKRLHDGGYLNNTLLILFADHGSRYDNSRATQRGKFNERLPFLLMAFPRWFRQKYRTQMANLREATKRLTTPFDLHATLLDVAGVGPFPGTPPRGISFFHGIPTNRTCQDAGIYPHWCTCLSQDANQELALNDPLVERSLREFENFVNNNLLASFIKNGTCLPITVANPFGARKMSLQKEVAEFVRSADMHGRIPEFDKKAKPPEDYVEVSFTSKPGNGTWEVTFTHNINDGNITVHPKQISRTNRYGSAPKCIQDQFPHLRPFCYCSAHK